MSIKSIAAKLFAQKIYNKTQVWASEPVKTQNNVFLELILSGDRLNLFRPK